MTSSIGNELSAKIEDCTMTSCTTVGLVDFSYLKFISDGTNWFAVGLAAQTLTSVSFFMIFAALIHLVVRQSLVLDKTAPLQMNFPPKFILTTL
jgi:hypothetical protein